MTTTDDTSAPDATEVKAKEAGVYVKYIGLALIGLAPALFAHQCSVSESKSATDKVAATAVDVAAKAKSDGQQTKNEAEAGYQVTRQAMEALEHRVLVLERVRHQRRSKAPALPADLKQAEKVVFAAAPTAPAAPPPPPPMIRRDATP